MEKDGIDASLGLAFSLDLFKRYKKSGKLQAEIHRFPGVKGKGTAFLSLIEGNVVSCYFEDRNGQQSPVSKDVLIRLDDEKGPFEWRFHPSTPMPGPTQISPAQMSPATQYVPSGYYQASAPRSHAVLLSDLAVPKIIAPLDWKQLRTWTVRQQQMLSIVWQLIDGKRSIHDIRTATGSSLPVAVVDEALHVLLELRVIVI